MFCAAEGVCRRVDGGEPMPSLTAPLCWSSHHTLTPLCHGPPKQQELVAAHPQLLPSAVADLSGGGSLPLHLAAASGCVATVQALLAAGAPLEAKDGKGQTALQVCVVCMCCLAGV